MRFSPRITALGCASLALVTSLGWWALDMERSLAKPPLPKPLQLETPAPPPAGEEVLDGGVQSSTTATITIWTVPYTSAVVYWGKKVLGKIAPGRPLVVVRPRDSGPLDLMVRAGGYMPVQTRAHTFNDSRLVVKLTRPDKKNELLGYRIPLDGGLPDGAIEGGVMNDAMLPAFPPAPAPWPQPAPAPPSMF
jgi:hypothetical protein